MDNKAQNDINIGNNVNMGNSVENVGNNVTNIENKQKMENDEKQRGIGNAY